MLEKVPTGVKILLAVLVGVVIVSAAIIRE
jgi:uncharacterized integral membrane protein